jgi:pimeloyl-ACP methyl ester carboxylesterase
MASALPDEISDRFDVVAWDPRGTGQSSPVDCGSRLDYLFAPDTAPDNATERAAREAAARKFANSCDRMSHDLIRNVSSVDTVQDLDQIRAALGESKLNFLGLSYGSYLGALYAERYPERVRALILDGAIDPALSIEDVSIEQSKGFEQSLDAFLADCAADDDCAFHHDGKPRRAFNALRARVDRRPIRADGNRVLGPSQFDLAVASPLYEGADGYEDLAESLRAAERGDPEPMLEAFDDYVGRRSDGTYSPEWAAFLAISCADGPELTPEALPALEANADAAAPTFGVSTIGLTIACSYWPIAPVNRVPTPLTAPDAPPIVVVGTTGDPATPIAWSQSLTRELGSARLITVEGTTHTSSMAGNTCLDAALTAYLVDRRPPRRDLHCPA